jgi:hypothetical protein
VRVVKVYKMEVGVMLLGQPTVLGGYLAESQSALHCRGKVAIIFYSSVVALVDHTAGIQRVRPKPMILPVSLLKEVLVRT